MKQCLCCILVGVISFLAATTYGQSAVTGISSISLTGGSSDSVGRITVSVTLANAFTTSTEVCDAVDWVTAIFICQQLGYIIPSSVGTVSSLGGVGTGQTPALIRGLTCEGVSSYSACLWQQALFPSCSYSDHAAISCILTPGEMAGIAIGVVLGCLLLICLPIIICCCCCCGLCACLTPGSSRREPPYSMMPGTYQQKVEVQINS